MSFALQQGTIGRSAIVAIIVVDSDGQERRIECEPPPEDVHLVQIVRDGGYVSSDRAFWTEEDANRERAGLLATARRRHALGVVDKGRTPQ